MADKARTAAYRAARRVMDGAYSNLISELDGLTGVDRAFAENIALGTLERKITLEYMLKRYLKKDTDKDLLTLLLTGAYQIFYLDRVPDNAACDETVRISAVLFGRDKAGFVNAVMRNLVRNKENLLDSASKIGGYITASMNKELYDLLASQYPNRIDAICKAFFGKSDVFLRVNSLKSDAISVAEMVGGKVINDRTVVVHDTAKAVKNIDCGNYFIQGLGSQRAVEWISAESGDMVIDVCACPGGKSLGTAIDMKNIGKIYSFDIHAKKLPLITKSGEKLGISIIETAVQDAKHAKTELRGQANRVICDVPCSGTGVMGSKPEIKYKSPRDFAGLYPTQRSILASSAEYLKVGGVMIYSTCSINKLENEAVVAEFLESHGNYRLEAEETSLPDESGREGFYTAKIIREK